MKVSVVAPFGFCLGVTKAIQMAEKAKQEHPNEPVYVIGDLVHNERIVESLRQKGLITLEGSFFSLEEQLSALPCGSVVVFTAHGHAPKWDEIALQKKMIVYDATCIFVQENEKIMKQEISQGGEVIYIGVPNHAEANAALAIDPKKVHLIAEKDDINSKVCRVNDPLIVCQTTLSKRDIEEKLVALLKVYPHAKVAAKRCISTEMRQENLERQSNDFDLVIILGSETSNNTRKLYEIAKQRFTNAAVKRILSADDLSIIASGSYHSALLVSGASSSAKDVIEVKKCLEKR